MKVLFSVFRYHTNMVSMVKALKKGGHEVLILAVAKEPYEAEHDSLVQILECTDQLPCQVKTVFEQFQPDVVVVRAALNEGAASIVAREAKKRRIKCISYEQNPCYHSSPIKALYIGLSHARAQIKKGLPIKEMSPKRGAAKGYPVPFRRYFHFPMCEQEGLEERTYFPDNTVRVTAIGKLGVERKRLDWVIDALESRGEKIKILLVGSNDLDRYPGRSRDYYNALYDKSHSMRQRGVVEIRENVPFREMSEIYKNTDIFVLPARGEKFGVSPLEAMSHGCAVICADDNGSTPYITNEYDGVVFKTDSYVEFCAGLYALIQDEKKIKFLGGNAISAIQANHGCARFVAEFMSFLK